MPSEDPAIGPFEDAVASWAQTPGSETLDWTPSLAPTHSREPEVLSRISAPPPSPEQTGGGHSLCLSASTSLLSGTA